MANIILILGIALLLAGAALVITGSSQVGQHAAWDDYAHQYRFSGGGFGAPHNVLDWLPAAMPLMPGALLIAWAYRLKHQARSRGEGS